MAAISQVSVGRAFAYPAESRLPICVDLDGTLIKTDSLLETFVAAVRHNPLVLFLAPLWLLRGRAALKDKLASVATINPALLPYNQALLDHLKERKKAGHELYLTTAADRRVAQSVADHLGIFDAVLASHQAANLKGARKLKAIRELLGDYDFLYAGNGRADLAMWQKCRGAITVDLPRSAKSYLRDLGIPVLATFDSPRSRVKSTIKALRIYQWSKNVLIFVPLLLAHALDASHVLPATIAFLAFSLCASTLYVVNDLLDIEVDRAHPRKRLRPFACGALGIHEGIGLILMTIPVVVALACWLPSTARWILATYAATSLLYSVRIKRVLFLDVLVLACLYALRMLLGAAATHITISIWTLAFSIFVFLGLALVKRLTELRRAKNQSNNGLARRGYLPVDVSMVRSFASSAFYAAALVMALYINSPDVSRLYRHPEALWFVCLLLVYWLSRILMLANRGVVADDPIVFAFRDRVSQYVGITVLICVVFAL